MQINKFHGPFDLLFYLIESSEVDIYDIPISEITEQYINYLDLLQDYDMSITSEFILMASTLLEIKSKMLLPQKEADDDPRVELVNQLLEYKLFRDSSEDLRLAEELESNCLSKPAEDIEYNSNLNEQLLFDEISAYDLLYTLQNLLKNKKIIIEDDFDFELEKDEFSISDCIKLINEKLGNLKKLNIMDIFELDNSKKFIITIFLSLLEMSKLRNLILIQDNIFGEIYIQKS